MSLETGLIKVHSEDFVNYVNDTIIKLWGPEVSNEGKQIFLQRMLELLSEQNIESVTPEDISVIIVSAINKQLMHPLSYLELFTTENCNLRCHHCFIRRKTKNRMSIKVALEAIDFFVMESGYNKNITVTFFGGEPLLEFELMKQVMLYSEKVSSSAEKQISFNVTTNGTLFTEDIMKFSKGRVSYLISIDGDKATHDRHRKTIRGKGSFDSIVSKLPMVRSYQPWIGARMTVYPDTVDAIMENVEYLYSIGFYQFVVGPSYGPEWSEKAYATYEEQLDKLGLYYIRKKQNKEHFRMTFFESKTGDRFCMGDVWGCRAGRNGVTISAEGKIYPCSKFLGLSSFNKELYCLGDIYTGITKLDVRDEISSMSEDQFTECIECDTKDLCVGGCPANNYNDRGSIFKPSPFDCIVSKIHKRVLQKFTDLEKIVNNEKIPVA